MLIHINQNGHIQSVGNYTVANEKLFVSSDDGKLYVFETDTTTHVAEEDDIKFNFNLCTKLSKPI